MVLRNLSLDNYLNKIKKGLVQNCGFRQNYQFRQLEAIFLAHQKIDDLAVFNFITKMKMRQLKSLESKLIKNNNDNESSIMGVDSHPNSLSLVESVWARRAHATLLMYITLIIPAKKKKY